MKTKPRDFSINGNITTFIILFILTFCIHSILFTTRKIFTKFHKLIISILTLGSDFLMISKIIFYFDIILVIIIMIITLIIILFIRIIFLIIILIVFLFLISIRFPLIIISHLLYSLTFFIVYPIIL